MAKRSIEQLRSATWETREQAVKDLQRNGFTSEIKALAETPGGRWFLEDRSDSKQEPDVAKNDIAGKKKPAISRIKSAQPQGPKPGKETKPSRKKGAAVSETASNVVSLPKPQTNPPAPPPAPASQKRRIGVPDPTSKVARATVLLVRDRGASYAEIDAILQRVWTPSFITRIGRKLRMNVEKIGEDRWRL